MPAKLNAQRELVEIDDPSDIPHDLALATKDVLLRLVDIFDIHKSNGDMAWVVDLAKTLNLWDPPGEASDAP